jgi:hypothetical protein
LGSFNRPNMARATIPTRNNDTILIIIYKPNFDQLA